MLFRNKFIRFCGYLNNIEERDLENNLKVEDILRT
jgi:hypothetical protein